MPASESKRRASAKWDAANCTMRTIKFLNPEYERLKSYCDANGISVNGFVRQAVEAALMECQESESRS